MYNAYTFTHMVISFSEEDGRQTETFRSLEEAEAFAGVLASEGHFYDIYITQVLRRVPCQLAEQDERDDLARLASARPLMRFAPLDDRTHAA